MRGHSGMVEHWMGLCFWRNCTWIDRHDRFLCQFQWVSGTQHRSLTCSDAALVVNLYGVQIISGS